MGKRGPAPKPTSLRVLDGDRRDRINTDEPVPAKGEVVAPAWLHTDARVVWDRLAPDLVTKGVLTPWDVDAFATFCSVVVANQQALAEVNRYGMTRRLGGKTVRNPAWQVARETSGLVATLGGRFGLNPSDRSQLSVGGGRGAAAGPERLLGG